jgi:cytochrome P450
MPGPQAMPILREYGNLSVFFRDPMGYLDKIAKHGDVAIFARGMRRGMIWPSTECPAAVFLVGPKLLQHVLTKHAIFPEAVVARFPPEWGGASRLTGGLLWLVGSQHRQHRRAITPLYHQKRVEGYRDLMVSVIGQALDGLVPGESIGVMDEAGKILSAFQSDMLLGVADLPGSKGKLVDGLVEFWDCMKNPMAHVLPFNLPFTPRRRLLEHGNYLSRELDELIAMKRAAKEPGADVLSMLVHSKYEDGSSMSDDELVSETLHLFVGGWVSTRSSLAWTSLLLAQHPKVMSDLYDELTGLLHGDAPTVAQLSELKLLDQVLKESLRLFPPIPFVSRVSNEAVELGGYRLPPRTELHLSLYHTHRDPELYPEPNAFKPERWNTLDPAPNEYLPFGIGPRVCPGKALATLQMKVLLAMLVQRYRFELPRRTNVRCAGIGIMAPTPDLQMIVRKQDRQFQLSHTHVTGNVNRMVDLPD